MVDDETGLSCYNYRYYNCSPGRWISRDLVADGSDINAYGYIGNEVPYRIDHLGLKTVSADEEEARAKEERERKMNSTRAARDMKALIQSHTWWRTPISGCGSENGKPCAKLTVIVEFGNPNNWFPYVGHASMGIDDRFCDYGPQTESKPNLSIVDAGGSYYDSTGYKKNHPETAGFNTKSVREVTKNVGKFSTGFVVSAQICICRAKAAEIEARMRELSVGSVYSIPGQQCASTVYAAIYDAWVWSKAALSPQGLMLKYISRLRHECGPNKGNYGYLSMIKDRLTESEKVRQ